MNKRYGELDSLRGIAAIMVVLSHFITLFPLIGKKIIYSTYGPFISTIWAGHSAVIMFFLLSGFVLSLPFYSEGKFKYSSYVIKRICRIYIPFIVAICAAIVLKAALHSKIGTIPGLIDWAVWDKPIEFKAMINHVLFLGEYDANSFLNVIWSLVHEMRISLIFPLIMMFLLKYNWRASILLSIGLSFISFILMKHIPSPFTSPVSTNYSITLHYAAMFVLGALLAKHREYVINKARMLKPKYKLLFIPLAILFYIYPRIPFMIPSKIIGEIDITLYFIVIDWIIAIGAILIMIMALSSTVFSKFLLTKPVHFMGEISYSVYLVHPIVLISSVHILYGTVPIPLILVISFMLTMIGSVLCHRYIEKPSIALGKLLTKSNKKTILYDSVKIRKPA